MVSISLNWFRQLKKEIQILHQKNYWQDRDYILRWFGKTDFTPLLYVPNKPIFYAIDFNNYRVIIKV